MAMKRSVDLWGGRDIEGYRPALEVYTLDGVKSRGAVLVCPGGGYAHRAPHEAGVIAEKYNSLGFHAFVLQYRVSPQTHPSPLEDAARAVRMIRANAREWGVLEDKIAILGFSAGGHLACSLGMHFSDVEADPGYAGVSCRPDAMILCYAVINDHEGSFKNLFGDKADDTARAYFQLNRHVCADTPPAFLWHTAEDQAVPVANALEFCAAMSAAKRPFELHVFPYGCHGLGLGIDKGVDEVQTWPELSATWLSRMGWK